MVNDHALERLRSTCAAHGFDAALVSNPATLTWLSGYAPPIQHGPSPFEGGPALGLWRDGRLTLVVSDMEASAARATGAEVREYQGYTIEAPLAALEQQAAALRTLLGEWRGLGSSVAVEWGSLPAPLADVVREADANATLRPLDGQLDGLRAIKSSQEIDKLRAALAVCDLGQDVLRAGLMPGISEIELWAEVKGRMETAVGERLPVLVDLVAGAARTAEIGGPPIGNVLAEGDPVIFDVVPRRDGYWGDTCGTYVVGQPSAEIEKAVQVVLGALRRGISVVRPGLRAGALDALVRDALREGGYEPHPHHSGHGIGVTYHEEPRIVGYNNMALQEGMVLTLEPGVYIPGVGGVRLEDVVLVTADGCEVLTHHLDGL